MTSAAKFSTHLCNESESIRLDSLMTLTGISNTALAVGISVVPSYISHIRRGNRKFVHNSEIAHMIAGYIGRQSLSLPQEAGICHLTGTDELPKEGEGRAEYLYQWLVGERADSGEENRWFAGQQEASAYGKPTVYLGVRGRQEAVARFLSEVAVHPGPQEILLYSDENIDWMRDPDFFTVWQGLCRKVLMAGNRFIMIHVLTRNPSEMLAGLYGWMPLYATGKIDPYYCPEPVSDVYRRTLFIAPETAVVTSQSVQDKSEGMPNLYVTDPKAIKAFTREYQEFLSLCKPLMQIFKPDTEEMISLLSELQKRDEIVWFYQPVVVPQIFFAEESPDAGFIHLICLDEPVPSAELAVSYLLAVLERMNTDPRYRVVLIRGKQEPYAVFLKERAGALVVAPTKEAMSFFFNEPNLTEALKMYMGVKCKDGAVTNPDEVREKIQMFCKHHMKK